MIVLPVLQVETPPDELILFVRPSSPSPGADTLKKAQDSKETPDILADGTVVVRKGGMRYLFAGDLDELERLRLLGKALGPILQSERKPSVSLGELGPEAITLIRDRVADKLPMYDPASVGPELRLITSSAAEIELNDGRGRTVVSRKESAYERLSPDERRAVNDGLNGHPLRLKEMPRGWDAAVEEQRRLDANGARSPGYSIRYYYCGRMPASERVKWLKEGAELLEAIVAEETEKVATQWAAPLAEWRARHPALQPRVGDTFRLQPHEMGDSGANLVVSRVRFHLQLSVSTGPNAPRLLFDVFP